MSNDELSKLEKIAIFSMLIVIAILILLALFTTPKYKPIEPQLDYTKTELEVENLKLKGLVDSLRLVDSLHLIQLKEKKVIIKKKKDEVNKVIKFIPTADSKFRDSLWTEHFKDTLWGDSLD